MRGFMEAHMCVLRCTRTSACAHKFMRSCNGESDPAVVQYGRSIARFCAHRTVRMCDQTRIRTRTATLNHINHASNYPRKSAYGDGFHAHTGLADAQHAQCVCSHACDHVAECTRLEWQAFTTADRDTSGQLDVQVLIFEPSWCFSSCDGRSPTSQFLPTCEMCL